MLSVDPLVTTQEEQFVVGNSDFMFYNNYVSRCGGCVFAFCTQGSAEITVNHYRGAVSRGTAFFLVPGAMLMFTGRTEDFRMNYCVCSKEMFAEAAFRLEPAFFHVLREYPITVMTEEMIQGCEAWFRMMEYTYHDRANAIRSSATVCKICSWSIMINISGVYLMECSRSRDSRGRPSCSIGLSN